MIRFSEEKRRAEERPSVRAKEVSTPPGEVSTPPEPETAFSARLAELGLSVRNAATFLSTHPKQVQRWKRSGAPDHVMAQLA